MTRPWQLWLSPRPKHRSDFASLSRFTTVGGAAIYEFLTEEDGSWEVRETHFRNNPVTMAGLSGPPLHIHLAQDERFIVEQGSLSVVADNTTHVITKDDGLLTIKAGIRHRFWCHESSTEDLIFHGRISPQDANRILDRNFLRNLHGYLTDCHREGIQPSPFQLVLFIFHASSLWTPPFWMPLSLLKGFNYLAAVLIGEKLLGYKPTYKEYAAESEMDGVSDLVDGQKCQDIC